MLEPANMLNLSIIQSVGNFLKIKSCWSSYLVKAISSPAKVSILFIVNEYQYPQILSNWNILIYISIYVYVYGCVFFTYEHLYL